MIAPRELPKALVDAIHENCGAGNFICKAPNCFEQQTVGCLRRLRSHTGVWNASRREMATWADASSEGVYRELAAHAESLMVGDVAYDQSTSGKENKDGK